MKADKSALQAGVFSVWLRQIRRALLRETGVDVPCGQCHACCQAGFFIHIRPEEKQTLARIPKKLLFPAPGLPKGNMLLGYFENGQCPMLRNGACSIYAHRPLTCRRFDCRILPAAGITAGGKAQAGIDRQISRWQFTGIDRQGQCQAKAVKAAAEYLQAHAGLFPRGFVPQNKTQLAVLAIKVYRVFLNCRERMNPAGNSAATARIIKAVLKADAQFTGRIDRQPD